MKLTKKRKEAQAKVDANKLYSISEASALLKDINCTKFDSSVDMHIRLGVDPRKADQAIRGTVSLPYGTGKSKSVVVLTTPDKEAEAKGAGADYVGLDDLIAKIEGGWTDFDVLIATPSVMPKMGKLGRILGPRNLMPNPKTGTVTNDVAQAVADVKGGKIAFKVDKSGIIHCSIGRVGFTPDKIEGNARELVNALIKMKPTTSKGIYLKGIVMATTMSPGVKVDVKTVS